MVVDSVPVGKRRCDVLEVALCRLGVFCAAASGGGGGSATGRVRLWASTILRMVVAVLCWPPERRARRSAATVVRRLWAIQGALKGPDVTLLSHWSSGLNSTS